MKYNKRQKAKLMKRLFLFLFGLMLWTANAQNDVPAPDQQAECKKLLSITHEFVKAKAYADAEVNWKKLYEKCPTFSKAVYIEGVKIYKAKIAKANDDATKKQLAEAMIKLYDERLKNFPDPTGRVLHDKGVMMVKYKVGTTDEIYNLFKDVFENHPKSFSHPYAYWGYFKAAVDKYKKGELTLEQVFELYDALEAHSNELIEEKTKEFEALNAKPDSLRTSKEQRKLRVLSVNLPAMAKIQGLMDRVLGDLGNCETLVPFYQKKFAENKNNVKWLGSAANRLAKKKCTDNKLFEDIVEAYHRLNPSAQSALFLAIRAKKKGQYDEAVKYYKNAINLETNPHKKADIYYALAVLAKKRGNKPLARDYAYKALKYKPSMGYAYLLIAGLYATSADQCGTTKFQKQAIFWKAAEMARKAAQADPTIRKKALAIAADYEKRAPSKKDVFLENMGGKIIKFDKCWVGGSVRVPTN